MEVVTHVVAMFKDAKSSVDLVLVSVVHIFLFKTILLIIINSINKIVITLI